MPRAQIGIGSALRDAREQRGKTIEEAARDTKIRREFLEALEAESFDSLQGDVYVRGNLRSYAQYLGLDPEKVSSSYSESVGGPVAPEPPAEDVRKDHRAVPTFASGHRTSSLVLAGGVALMLLIMAGAFGLLSGSHSTPNAAPLPSNPPTAEDESRKVTVSLVALHEVTATIVIDGSEEFSGTLDAKEARSFSGMETITIQLSRGGVVNIVANGEDKGSPGQAGNPYSATFTPPPTRSPSASPSPTRRSPRPPRPGESVAPSPHHSPYVRRETPSPTIP